MMMMMMMMMMMIRRTLPDAGQTGGVDRIIAIITVQYCIFLYTMWLVQFFVIVDIVNIVGRFRT